MRRRPATGSSVLPAAYSRERYIGMLRSVVRTRTSFLACVMIALVFLFSWAVEGFASSYNLLNMSKYAVEIGLLALAETVVMVSGGGGIDLSVGSMVGLLSMICGLLSVKMGVGPGTTALLAVLAGVALGSINGALASLVRIPPLIATLGTMYVYRSLALVLSGGMPFSGFSSSFSALGQSTFLGIPLQVVLVLLPAFALVHLVLTKTVLGRYLYGTGCSEEAARFALIRVDRTRFMAYAIGGVLVSLAAFVLTARVATAKPDAGTGMELQAITIAVLGGTSSAGGKGTAVGTLMAALTVVMIYNALDLSGIHPIWQLGTLGTLLIVSVLLNQIVGHSR